MAATAAGADASIVFAAVEHPASRLVIKPVVRKIPTDITEAPVDYVLAATLIARRLDAVPNVAPGYETMRPAHYKRTGIGIGTMNLPP